MFLILFSSNLKAEQTLLVKQPMIRLKFKQKDFDNV